MIRRLGLPLWHPAGLIATGGGIGLLPVMPGTWGSLAALPCAWVIRSLWGVAGLAIAAAIVFAVGGDTRKIDKFDHYAAVAADREFCRIRKG